MLYSMQVFAMFLALARATTYRIGNKSRDQIRKDIADGIFANNSYEGPPPQGSQIPVERFGEANKVLGQSHPPEERMSGDMYSYKQNGTTFHLPEWWGYCSTETKGIGGKGREYLKALHFDSGSSHVRGLQGYRWGTQYHSTILLKNRNVANCLSIGYKISPNSDYNYVMRGNKAIEVFNALASAYVEKNEDENITVIIGNRVHFTVVDAKPKDNKIYLLITKDLTVRTSQVKRSAVQEVRATSAESVPALKLNLRSKPLKVQQTVPLPFQETLLHADDLIGSLPATGTDASTSKTKKKKRTGKVQEMVEEYEERIRRRKAAN